MIPTASNQTPQLDREIARQDPLVPFFHKWTCETTYLWSNLAVSSLSYCQAPGCWICNIKKPSPAPGELQVFTAGSKFWLHFEAVQLLTQDRMYLRLSRVASCLPPPPKCWDHRCILLWALYNTFWRSALKNWGFWLTGRVIVIQDGDQNLEPQHSQSKPHWGVGRAQL